MNQTKYLTTSLRDKPLVPNSTNNYIPLSGILMIVLLGLFIFTACTEEDDIIDDNPMTVTDVGWVTGQVTGIDGFPLRFVSVEAGKETTETDNEGNFLLEYVPVGEQVVSFNLDGYASNYKTTRVVKDQYSIAIAALSTIDVEVQIDPTQQSEISFNGAKVDIPANAIVTTDGGIVSGNYSVQATYFDPKGDHFFDIFPGNFEGESAQGSEGILESYGFVDVTLDQNGRRLDLAEGSEATISIPIPEELLGTAPDPIPLFYFDEEAGIWKEEGFATIQNGSYVGQVEHFSKWNADVLFVDETCIIKGRVVDQNGTPLPLARVKAVGIDFRGGNTATTGNDGRFSMKIKSDARVAVNAQYATPLLGILLGVSDTKDISPTCPPGGMNDIGDLIINIDTSSHSGTTTDNVWWDVEIGRHLDVWVVGRGGQIQYSSDYGTIWEVQQSNTTQTLLGVCFTDDLNGWVCGNNGAIRRTSNGGNTWETVVLNTVGNDLYEVLFVDSDHGWMVGTVGNIWRTTNGGIEWNKINTNIPQDLHDVSFANTLDGWAVGNLGVILHTSDGGINWSSQSSGTSLDLYGVSFISNKIGWAVGLNGTILYTENGGELWQNQSSGTGEDLLSVEFQFTNFGVAVGTNGKTIVTQNGGVTWESESFGASGKCWDVALGERGGYIVGEEFKTPFVLPFPPVTNGWKEIAVPIDEFYFRVKFKSPQDGWIVGANGTIIHSTDQGDTWSIINSGTTENINDLSFTENAVYVCGDSKTLLRTENDGASWANIRGPNDGHDFSKVEFMDNQTGWLMEETSIGGYSRLWYTYVINDTLNWALSSGLPYSQNHIFTDFQFTSGNEGWLVGYEEGIGTGFLYHSINGGQDWTQVLEKEYSGFTNIYFVDTNNGWIGEISGTLLKTTDGGQNWEIAHDYLLYNSETKFIDPNYGWAMAGGFTGGGPFHTRDGGYTWFEQGSPDGKISNLIDFYMIDANVGIAVGGWINEGKIYKTTTGGN